MLGQVANMDVDLAIEEEVKRLRMENELLRRQVAELQVRASGRTGWADGRLGPVVGYNRPPGPGSRAASTEQWRWVRQLGGTCACSTCMHACCLCWTGHACHSYMHAGHA